MYRGFEYRSSKTVLSRLTITSRLWSKFTFVSDHNVRSVSSRGGASALRWSERFDHWGYPAHTPYIVGIVEMLGGLAVLVPRWRRAASLALGAIMAVALCTHVAHGEFPRILPPLLLGGLAFLLSRLRY